MTREEAKNLLDNLIGFVEDNHGSDYDEALKMAIKALEQEPCEDCISRQAVLEPYQTLKDSDTICIWLLRKNIEQQPSVTPQPKTGHWIKVGDRGFGWSDTVICKCSECEYQKEFTGKFDGQNLIVDMEHADNYCPNCGAKMEAER